jgi:hypothetical protein
VTLDAALESGTAVVREIGAEPATPSPPPQQLAPSGTGAPDDPPAQARPSHPRHHPRTIANHGGDGAQVNKLVIENKGSVAILVLAGTIVKGGKQDRQIGQDFVIGPKETQPVDAFCIERGRWNGEREGASTDGKFRTMKVLAIGSVRAAGQYEQDQGRVWQNVSEINKAHGKQTASDTLVASVEDEQLSKRRAALALDVLESLAKVPQPRDVVGVAYAVDGKVRGVRSFLNHEIFREYAEILANTFVLEALTAEAAAKTAGKPSSEGRATPDAVVAFVRSVADGKKQERDTGALNTNQYTIDDQGYAAETHLKPAARPADPAAAAPTATAAAAATGAAPARAAPPKKALTRDYLSL